MRGLWNSLSSGLALLLPRECPVCGGDLPWNAPAGVCRSCWSEIRPLQPPFCELCGLPYESFLPTGLPYLCSACRRRKPPFHRARSLGRYEGTLREILRLFKYAGRREIGDTLGGLMAAYQSLQAPPGQLDAVLAVPLHRSRRRQRGFNQADDLARSLCRSLGLPRLPGCLVRDLPTPPQTGLSRMERRRNVRNSFRVRKSGPFRGIRLLLVDDILTTGATVAECARVIRRAGARRVEVLTAARTPAGG